MDTSNRKEVEEQIQDFPSTSHSGRGKELDRFKQLDYGERFQSPILGYRYRSPDLPTNYIPSIILDTSLLHVRFNIPIYAHLKIYDLKPVQLSEMPPILSALHLQFSEDTIFGKSLRGEMSSARITEEGKLSSLWSARDNVKIVNKK